MADRYGFAVAFGGLLAAIVCFLVIPLTPDFASMHVTPTNQDPHIQGKNQGLVTPFWILAGASYALALWQWRRGNRPSWRLLVGGALALTAVALLVPPVSSEDIYAYSFYGAVQRDYGVNPYLAFPDRYPLHPWYPFWSWRHIGPVYGPPFLWFARWVAELAGPSLLSWVLWVKGILTVAQLVGVWLLVRACRAGGARGIDAGWPVLVVAWSPMALQATMMAGHIDAVLLTLVAGAILAHRRGRHVLAFALLAGMALVKIYAGPLAVIYGVWLASQQAGLPAELRRLARLGLLGLSMLVLAYLPFASAGMGLLDSVRDVGGNFSGGTIGNVIRWVIAWILPRLGVLGPSEAFMLGETLGSRLTLGTAMVWIVVCMWQARRLPDGQEPWHLLATYFLGYLLITPWVFDWHALPLLGLVTVIPWGAVAMASTVLTIMLMPTGVGERATVTPPTPLTLELSSTIRTLLTKYGAAWAIIAVGWRRHRRSERAAAAHQPRPDGSGAEHVDSGDHGRR